MPVPGRGVRKAIPAALGGVVGAVVVILIVASSADTSFAWGFVHQGAAGSRYGTSVTFPGGGTFNYSWHTNETSGVRWWMNCTSFLDVSTGFTLGFQGSGSMRFDTATYCRIQVAFLADETLTFAGHFTGSTSFP